MTTQFERVAAAIRVELDRARAPERQRGAPAPPRERPVPQDKHARWRKNQRDRYARLHTGLTPRQIVAREEQDRLLRQRGTPKRGRPRRD